MQKTQTHPKKPHVGEQVFSQIHNMKNILKANTERGQTKTCFVYVWEINKLEKMIYSKSSHNVNMFNMFKSFNVKTLTSYDVKVATNIDLRNCSKMTHVQYASLVHLMRCLSAENFECSMFQG